MDKKNTLSCLSAQGPRGPFELDKFYNRSLIDDSYACVTTTDLHTSGQHIPSVGLRVAEASQWNVASIRRPHIRISWNSQTRIPPSPNHFGAGRPFIPFDVVNFRRSFDNRTVVTAQGV
uniref:Uncharacterized protein n=1 Tax=Romanomermis culicivorax TaxID=13658 RepID=A0A915JLZ4_ROMCU